MVVPIKFRRGSEALANFPYGDIAEGIGFATYYLANMSNNPTASFLLTPEILRSEIIDVARTSNTPGQSIFNFDSAPFNLPRVARGTAYFSGGVECAGTTIGEQAINVQLQKLHADGSTTTNLVSDVTMSYGLATGGAARKVTTLISMPLTETIIEPNEKLRLVVKLRTAGDDDIWLGVDPANRDGTTITPSTETTLMTSSRVLVPFRIDP